MGWGLLLAVTSPTLQKLSLSEKFEREIYFEMGRKQKEIAKKISTSQ